MRALTSLVLIHFVVSTPGSADEKATSASTNASSHAVSSSAIHDSTWIQLNGICTTPPIRKALLEIRTPGQDTLRCVLGEGEQAAGVELLAIHEGKGKVTIRHRGTTNELALANIGTSDPELEKDVSHREHHKMRARLDRERDALQSAAAEPDLSKTNQEHTSLAPF